MLIPESVDVRRNEGGHYHVRWQTSEPDINVTVCPRLPDGSGEVYRVQGDRGEIRLTGLPETTFVYFELSDDCGTRVVATDRRVPLRGAPNFRDFGGYHTVDGRAVRWGYLFRSGHLANIEDADLQLLSTLELDLVCDFRHEREQQVYPNRWPRGDQPKVLSVPIAPGSNLSLIDHAQNGLTREAMMERMVKVNMEFAESQTEAYSRMFAAILDMPSARILLHCSAGKDRTGFGAALVLLALGVPKTAVLRDYMLTGRYFDPVREFTRIRSRFPADLRLEDFRPVLEVNEIFLSAALTAIEQRYGTLARYLDEALGVGKAELKELSERYVE